MRTYFSTRPCDSNENILTNNGEMISYSKNYRQNVHNATAITTGSANQRPNTPCIRLWIDVIFRGLEDSYKTNSFSIFQEQEVGPDDAHYAWPPSVLKYLRALAPSKEKGETRKVRFKDLYTPFTKLFTLYIHILYLYNHKQHF